jgi:hypothetical protein
MNKRLYLVHAHIQHTGNDQILTGVEKLLISQDVQLSHPKRRMRREVAIMLQDLFDIDNGMKVGLVVAVVKRVDKLDLWRKRRTSKQKGPDEQVLTRQCFSPLPFHLHLQRLESPWQR